MSNTANNHLCFKRQLASGSKQIRDHKCKVVHDEVKRTSSTESLILINVSDDGLEGCIGSEDKKEKYSEFDSLDCRIAKHTYFRFLNY